MAWGLEVRELYRVLANDLVALYVKGHEDKDAFMNAVRDYLSNEGGSLEIARDFDVKYEWWKNEALVRELGPRHTLFRGSDAEDPRAFPVTVLDLAVWER